MTTKQNLEVPALPWNPMENANYISSVYAASRKAYRDALLEEFKKWDAAEQDAATALRNKIRFVAGQLRSKGGSWSGGPYGSGNIAESIERDVLVEVLDDLARTL